MRFLVTSWELFPPGPRHQRETTIDVESEDAANTWATQHAGFGCTYSLSPLPDVEPEPVVEPDPEPVPEPEPEEELVIEVELEEPVVSKPSRRKRRT
jgi:hypothetical protein